ncbi:MAG: restriction endonuclease [Acidobacteriaceae bacterium]
MADSSLHYAEIIGQEDAVARLKAFTKLFASSGATPAHILLIGNAGMGKTTIAITVANERKVRFQQTTAASIAVQGDLTALVTNLLEGQVVLLSNIQFLRKPILEKLRGALRDAKLTITIGQGPAARAHVMEIHPFTLIATCPRKSDCPADLFNEFSLVLTLQPYSKNELQALAVSIGKSAGISLEPGAAELIARASDGRPGHIASTLRRLAKAINKAAISEEDVARAFAAFGIAVRSDASHEGAASIRDLSGVEFESLISGLLTRMGFQAEMTRTTGDGGIDIIAMLDKPIVGGRYLFQCKRFAPENLVGAPTVRDFYGAVTADRAVKGVFITTSSYTAQAREFAEKAGVELIDLVQLEKLFLEYGLTQLAED